MKDKLLILALVLGLQQIPLQAHAQEKWDDRINMSLSVQSMFYWRGAPLSVFSTAEQTPTPLVIGEFNYTINHFKFGFWTGQSFNSSGFKNASYYVQYATGNFSLTVWDVYNYSGIASSRSRDYFNYSNSKTQHFIDVILEYQIPQSPISFTLASIVYGRDGNYIDSQTYRNRYSTYFKTNYRMEATEVLSFDFFASVSAALNDIDGTNFYATPDATRPYGINELGINANREIHITKNYSVGLTVGAVASPLNRRFDGFIGIRLL